MPNVMIEEMLYDMIPAGLLSPEELYEELSSTFRPLMIPEFSDETTTPIEL